MKIICVGRNYAQHAREMGSEVPQEPVLFLKPDSSVILKRQPLFLPSFSCDVHYEVELLVKINRVGKHIEEHFAHRYYDEVSLGIDFTARDVQAELKKKGLPWEKAKAFDGSAAIGQWVNKSEIGPIPEVSFRLEKNGSTVQKGKGSEMIFSVDRLIAYISKYFTLKKGDVLFTGTPEGVGPVSADDRLKAFLGDQCLLELLVK